MIDGISTFTQMIWDFYGMHKRYFPWRHNDDPYRIMISEIMLQQTQTDRVVLKYEQFIQSLGSFEQLAHASLRDVLLLWQGLGYNRRALYAHQAAQIIVEQYDGVMPKDVMLLRKLPGIGPNTAGSISAFAFNKPVVFIETNIRTVYIHTFFPHQTQVHDKELMPYIIQTLDQNNPREWYYALMDYGAYLKKMLPNPNRKSAHYTKQSIFKGSDRQIRGAIIRLLTKHPHILLDDVYYLIQADKTRIYTIIDELTQEGFIIKVGNLIMIKS